MNLTPLHGPFNQARNPRIRVRLLSRYILRQMALPFVFGLLALTGIMLLNVIARRFPQLWGKGLPWTVIGEVFFLSLPFILAMSLPLAVLAATLYAFTHLSTDSEVTAMRAGGVSTWGMLRPVLAFAILMGCVTFLFVDQVLPRSNSRLRNLWFDIGRKKPTFQLSENVVNPIPPSQQLFLRASRIEPVTGRLTSVSIYDIGQSDRRRVIYADSGVMGLDQKGRALVLRLFDGSIHTIAASDRPAFQHTAFKVQEIVIGDVFDELERNQAQLDRGDREMTSCELRGVVDSARWEAGDARLQRAGLVATDLDLLLGLPTSPVPARDPAPGPYRGTYCGLAARLTATPMKTSTPDPAAQGGSPRPPGGDTAVSTPVRASLPPPVPTPAVIARLADYGSVSNAVERERIAQRRGAKYLVEVHKKLSLAFAPIPFALIAVVMALRFPRGGMGLVMGGGMFVYAIFYVGLNAGESLADRGHLPPALAMWSPNIILGTLALIGLVLIRREYGSPRGGQ